MVLIAGCRPPLSITTGEDAVEEAPGSETDPGEASKPEADAAPRSKPVPEQGAPPTGNSPAPGQDMEPKAPTEPEPEPEPEQPHPERNWTIAVYMSGDNELESQALEDLNEMEAAAPAGDRMTVVALVDRAEGHATANRNWSETRLYEVVHDPLGEAAQLVSTRLGSAHLGLTPDADVELNTGAARTLSGFVSFVTEAYPARHTALVLWGSGSGYRAISVDDGAGADPLLTSELSQALESHMLDVIALDLAFGAQIEIAYELRGHASQLIASQQTVSLDGWEYNRLLDTLAADSEGPDAFRRAAISAFAAERASTSGATISAIDLAQVETAAQALDELSNALYDYATTNERRNGLRSLLFSDIEDFYRTPGDLNLDLGDLARQVTRAYPHASEVAQPLAEAVDAAVLESWSAPGANERASGLSVHFIPIDDSGYAFPPHDAAYFAGRIGPAPPAFVSVSDWVPNDTDRTGLLYRLWYESL
jgi:hypothetical protein